MDAKKLFAEAVKEAGSCVLRVEPAQLGGATPCTEWDLRALLGHMVYEMSWVADLLAGKTVAEVGAKYDGDLLGGNAPGAWQRASEAALAAVEATDLSQTVHLSYGNFPAEHYIRESGTDMLIHGWDAGQAINCSIIFDKQLAQAVYDFVLPRADEFRVSGLFGEQLPTSETASLQTKLLAFYGRSEKRQAS